MKATKNSVLLLGPFDLIVLGVKSWLSAAVWFFLSYLCLSYIFVSLKYFNNYTSLNQHFRNIAACRFVHSALDKALDKDLYVSEAWMLQHGGTQTVKTETLKLLPRTVCNTVTETSQIWP